jgi:hypothetical protein
MLPRRLPTLEPSRYRAISLITSFDPLLVI